MALLTLEEHNALVEQKRIEQYRKSLRLNGIACPKCGEELVDVGERTIHSRGYTIGIQCLVDGWEYEREG